VRLRRTGKWSPISTTASCRHHHHRKPLPMAFPWARCSAVSTLRQPSLPHARDDFRRRASGLRCRHRRHRCHRADNLLAHVVDVGTYFREQLQELAVSSCHHGCPRHRPHARTRTRLGRVGHTDRSADDGPPHHHQPDQRNGPPFPSTLHSGALHVDLAVRALKELFTNHAEHAGAALKGEHANG